MKIPKKIRKKNKVYTYVKQCNENMFLYEERSGYKETFNKHDLGMRKEMMEATKNIRVEQVKI